MSGFQNYVYYQSRLKLKPHSYFFFIYKKNLILRLSAVMRQQRKMVNIFGIGLFQFSMNLKIARPKFLHNNKRQQRKDISL